MSFSIACWTSPTQRGVSVVVVVVVIQQSFERYHSCVSWGILVAKAAERGQELPRQQSCTQMRISLIGGHGSVLSRTDQTRGEIGCCALKVALSDQHLPAARLQTTNVLSTVGTGWSKCAASWSLLRLHPDGVQPRDCCTGSLLNCLVASSLSRAQSLSILLKMLLSVD